MQINNLTYFQHALLEWNKLDVAHEPLPLSENQIEIMEREIYCDEISKFPIALREFLFLTGGFCQFFVSGCDLGRKEENTLDTEILLKEQKLASSRSKKIISFENRPIWAFSTHYESTDSFNFIYLDEDDENPLVYFYNDEEYEAGATHFIHKGGSCDVQFLKNVRFSRFIIELYKSSCSDSYNRPSYNVKLPSLYIENTLIDRILVSEQNQHTFYALIAKRDIYGVNYFIKKGIDVTANNNQAIVEAVKVNDPDVFDILISNGADPISRGEEILDIAILNNYISRSFYHDYHHKSILKIMLEKIEFSVQVKNRALVKSTELKVRRSMKDLIDNGAKISAYNFIKKIMVKITRKNRH
jgi:hypothetical protein